MNYPIWELSWFGGGTLIAIIAVAHVYISHLAVGGGIFLWLTDRRGFKENNPDIHGYVKKHTWFFLLLTMVFGGMSGVGIWFVISLVNPAATSKLIHTFVFGWAIEWVFFLGEIVALLIYHYFFDDLEKKARLTIAFFYALFAWLSLVVINAILSFMLTPGQWLQTHSFWDGMLNPTYLSSTFFRTFAATMIAGLFGYVTAVILKRSDFRMQMLKYCSKWLLYSLAGLVLTGLWYFYSIPAGIRETTFALNNDTNQFVTALLVFSVLIFVFGIFMNLRSSVVVQKLVVSVLVVIGLGWMGGFEYVREIARKPFIINEYMYSTSIVKAEVDQLNTNGLLTSAKWSPIKNVTDDNLLEAGRELFNIQCLSCHTVGGFRNSINKHVEGIPYTGVLSLMEGMGKISSYMPPVIGTVKEKEALATYIVEELLGGSTDRVITRTHDPIRRVAVPPFDQDSSQYVLLAWSDFGMQSVSDCDKWFTLLPPSNTLEAQLIGRGDDLGIVIDGVELSYSIDPDLEMTAGDLSGVMALDEETLSFVAHHVPLLPYSASDGYNPYPTFTIEAHDAETGELLASTKLVAPTFAEMGCRTCHGGPWRHRDQAGISDETAANILKAHDRRSGTHLHEMALDGEPRQCQSCHADPLFDAEGDSTLLNLSAAIHGWHANYVPFEGKDACLVCHLSSSVGTPWCVSGVHSIPELGCTDCHGSLADHSLSLLATEQNKRGASRLMKNLTPEEVATVEEINGRIPWVNEPECLTCHLDFELPEEDPSGFNEWTADMSELFRVRGGEAEIRCAACHNAPHNIYPTPTSDTIENIHNLQPMQYMGRPYAIGEGGGCVVCHMMEMDEPIHHENMNREARNRL